MTVTCNYFTHFYNAFLQKMALAPSTVLKMLMTYAKLYMFWCLWLKLRDGIIHWCEISMFFSPKTDTTGKNFTFIHHELYDSGGESFKVEMTDDGWQRQSTRQAPWQHSAQERQKLYIRNNDFIIKMFKLFDLHSDLITQEVP